MKKIKVCFVLGTLDVGGTEKQLLLLCKYIDREKFHPFVISLRGGRMKNDFTKENIPVFVIGKKYRFDLIALFKLILILNRIKPDILHTFMFTSNTWGRIAGIINGVPVIVASERSTDLWKKKYHFFVDRVLGFFTDKIICNSYSVMERYRSVLGNISRKLVVIRNGIEFQTFETDKSGSKRKNEKIVFTASRLSPEKGIRFLIESARIVLRQKENVKFLIAGEGPLMTELKYLADRYGIEKQFIFLGYKNDIQNFIEKSDVVVLPSLWEGLPNLVLEAMAMRKPVVATNVGGTSEVVKDGITGFLVNPGDIQQMAEKIILLLSDEKLAEEIGKKGYEFVKGNFDVCLMVYGYRSLYETLLTRRK
ncbi:MAG: glycosyltransferase [Candidatus Omnitrophica bacterium]|nr:glycosyltransferase [Candidatus Omnitrophota bacterium]